MGRRGAGGDDRERPYRARVSDDCEDTVVSLRYCSTVRYSGANPAGLMKVKCRPPPRSRAHTRDWLWVVPEQRSGAAVDTDDLGACRGASMSSGVRVMGSARGEEPAVLDQVVEGSGRPGVRVLGEAGADIGGGRGPNAGHRCCLWGRCAQVHG